ncbi:hypothetical protein, partial [Burkholderia stabilis]
DPQIVLLETASGVRIDAIGAHQGRHRHRRRSDRAVRQRKLLTHRIGTPRLTPDPKHRIIAPTLRPATQVLLSCRICASSLPTPR